MGAKLKVGVHVNVSYRTVEHQLSPIQRASRAVVFHHVDFASVQTRKLVIMPSLLLHSPVPGNVHAWSFLKVPRQLAFEHYSVHISQSHCRMNIDDVRFGSLEGASTREADSLLFPFCLRDIHEPGAVGSTIANDLYLVDEWNGVDATQYEESADVL